MLLMMMMMTMIGVMMMTGDSSITVSDCMTFNALYVCFISSHEKCFNDFPVWIFHIFPILFLYL